MKRRQFLAHCLSAAAVATLPSPPPKPPAAPVHPHRLTVAYSRIECDLKQPFSLLHISDTHLTEADDEDGSWAGELRRKRSNHFGGRQEEALRASIEWARSRTDLLLHTGDVMDWFSGANLRLARHYLGGMMACAGNHEYRPARRKGRPSYTDADRMPMRDSLARLYPEGLGFAVRRCFGVKFVLLDNAFGTVTPSQVERFREEVREGLPMVLCQHVPFYSEGLWLFDHTHWSGERVSGSAPAIRDGADFRRQLDDGTTRGFVEMLRKERLLKAILCGHMHLFAEERFSPWARQYVVAGNYAFNAREVLFC
ncbi:MAG: metallophosphoesterase family protein [Kiritimatiellia bacterium]